jgi:hypothetical protein
VEAVLLVSLVKHDPKQVGRHKAKVSHPQPRVISRWKKLMGVWGKLFLGILPLILMLLSCRPSNLGIPNNWDTYHNSRYGFDFPYPSHWIPFPMPDNRDGRAFRDPKTPSLEIRGWAANKLVEIQASSPKKPDQESSNPQRQNFTTDQGLTGELQVEVGTDISLMTLTLSQDKVQYNWQGQCESKQFADNYRLFYSVATQYRLPSPEQR